MTSRTDRATGVVFAATEIFAGAQPRQPMNLLGVGTRKKAILNIYSVGFYVSKPLWKELTTTTTTSKNAKTKIPAKGPKRCQAIVDSKAPKAVKLTFVMGIGPEKIAEAMSGLKGVSESVRAEFHDMIVKGLSGGGGKMHKGESMSFEWAKGRLDTITVTARGKSIGSMRNKELAQGVLSLYVGPKSVSPSLLEDLHCR